jgi:hypothetical protein
LGIPLLVRTCQPCRGGEKNQNPPASLAPARPPVAGAVLPADDPPPPPPQAHPQKTSLQSSKALLFTPHQSGRTLDKPWWWWGAKPRRRRWRGSPSGSGFPTSRPTSTSPGPPRNTYGLPLLTPRLPFSAQLDSLSLQLGFSQLYVHSNSVVAAAIRGYFGYYVSILTEKFQSPILCNPAAVVMIPVLS